MALPLAQPAGCIFQRLYEAPAAELRAVPVPNQKVLNAISKEALLLVFDQRRLAKITRPRNSADDINLKAAAHLNGQVTLGASCWANTSVEAEFSR